MNTQSYNFREAITPEVERTERYMRRGRQFERFENHREL